MMTRALLLSMLLGAAQCQLRPRRVGTNALGEQEVVLTDVPTGGSNNVPAASMAGGADGIAQMMEAMGGGGDMAEKLQAMMGGAGGEGLDMASLLKNMDLENNPMIKAMSAANPELAKVFSDPEALKGQMEQMAEMMSSPEGQNLAQKMVKEMQSVMTDPEKLKAGLAQLSSNPALKGLADAVPGLSEILEDPAALEEQATKAAEMFQNLQDPEKAQEMLAALGGEGGGDMMEKLQAMMGGEGGAGLEEMQKAMQQMASMFGDGDRADDAADLLSGLGEGFGGGLDEEDGGESLKARVREQMAQMMNKRRAGMPSSLDDDEAF